MKRFIGLCLIIASLGLVFYVYNGQDETTSIQEQMKAEIIQNQKAQSRQNPVNGHVVAKEVPSVNRINEKTPDIHNTNINIPSKVETTDEDMTDNNLILPNIEENQETVTTSSETSKKEKIAEVIANATAILTIPKIDVEVAVTEGVTMDNLKYAVAHYTETAAFGANGNACVAGHRSYTYNEFFNRLDELSIDDQIQVTTAEGTFRYKVSQTLVVAPRDTWVLQDQGKAELTLITCTPIRTATHRLIIKADLVTE